MKPNKTRNHSRQISLLALALALSLALTACQAADPGMAPAPPESKVPAQSAPVGDTTPDTGEKNDPVPAPSSRPQVQSRPVDDRTKDPVSENPQTTPRFDPAAQVPMTPSDSEIKTMAEPPAPPSTVISKGAMPETPGTNLTAAAGAEIDWSNVSDGYVCVRYPEETWTKLKAQVIGPQITYSYDLHPGKNWTTLPLSDGEGTYTARVLQNVQGTKYAILAAATFEANLKDEFGPFLRPNQYVDYENSPNVIAMAASLAGGTGDPLEKVKAIYDWTTSNLSYDSHLAATVQSGYLPNLEEILSTKTGICFDYAALMTAMLRCQGVPTKLVIGYAGTVYHAWVSVWTKETGWIDGVIFFNGTTWQRMDPTFAGTSANREAMEKYIGDGSNYSAKYLY